MAQAWLLPAGESAQEWVPRNIIIPGETETPGLFDLDLFPHVRDVLALIDDPGIRQIYLMWAARNAKTTTALAMLAFFAATAPRPMLFGSSNEEKADDTIETQLYPLLEASPLRKQLPPPHARNKRYIAFRQCRIRRSFSGSPSTMAGFPACYGVASEVSKWSRAKSTEADPLKLFVQRGKLYPFESKYLFESTPGTKGSCRISELYRANTTDRRQRWVPCTRCGEFQLLRMGNKKERGGIKWEKNAKGRSEPLRAAETAYYECEKCAYHIPNAERPEMMRAGKWLSEGLSIDPRGKVTGTPRILSPYVGLGPLSSLYSLAIGGWGTIAVEFLEAAEALTRGNKEPLRDFTNSTLSLEWDPAPQLTSPHELAGRLCSPNPAGVVPDFGKILTCGIDVQDSGKTFVWIVVAWGDGGRGQEVEHGIATSFEALTKDVLTATWPHADKGPRLGISFRLMDSGDEAETVYQLCRSVRNMLPAKGMNRPFNAEFRLATLEAKQRRNRQARGQVQLVEVNTDWTQKWIQAYIDADANPAAPGFALAAESALDLGFLDELLNEQRVEEIDAKGYPVVSWRRVNAHQPNDYRDALRLAKVAASHLTQHGKLWHKLPPRQPPRPKQPETPETYPTPDGRPFFIAER